MEQEYDVVNKPKHYNREGAMECIDEMILIFGLEETKSFCKLNAWKYRYRAADKNGEEDLKKSDWYLQKYKELSGKDQKELMTNPYFVTTPNIINTPLISPNDKHIFRNNDIQITCGQN